MLTCNKSAKAIMSHNPTFLFYVLWINGQILYFSWTGIHRYTLCRNMVWQRAFFSHHLDDQSKVTHSSILLSVMTWWKHNHWRTNPFSTTVCCYFHRHEVSESSISPLPWSLQSTVSSTLCHCFLLLPVWRLVSRNEGETGKTDDRWLLSLLQ